MEKCLIVVNTYKAASGELGSKMQTFLQKLGLKADIFLFSGGLVEGNPFIGYDFAITLGGDGTVLFAARGCSVLHIPIFPVNLGTFGFIASVQKNHWKELLSDFLAGNMEVQERSMIQAALFRQGEKVSCNIGLNEVLIGSRFQAQIGRLKIDYNDVPLGLFHSDGIIISTATGSTAYSAAAGGPIIDPCLDAFVLTMSNSFSLSSRPLILNPQGELKITVLHSRVQQVIMTIDGLPPQNLLVDDCIKITRALDKVLLAGCTQLKFYQALRSKLNWAGGGLA